MNKAITLTLMIVLASSLLAAAQTDTSNDSSMKKDKMAGNSMSMTGCIAEKDGKYMMMNKEHPNGVQLMGSEDMKSHMGQKMKVNGVMEKMDSGDSMKSDQNSNDNMKHDDMMGMKVSSMKMMSDQCDMSTMMKK